MSDSAGEAHCKHTAVIELALMARTRNITADAIDPSPLKRGPDSAGIVHLRLKFGWRLQAGLAEHLLEPFQGARAKSAAQRREA